MQRTGNKSFWTKQGHMILYPVKIDILLYNFQMYHIYLIEINI